MKQVLLSVASTRSVSPVVLWMGDDTQLGDTFIWRKKVCTVTAVYGTRLPHDGTEADHTDRPRRNQQAAVILDDHPS